jgi:hypothetical protein
MLCLAIPSESYQLIEEIGQQIEEYQSKPRRLLPNGEPADDIHGFLEWLQGLKDGWAELPEVIPMKFCWPGAMVMLTTRAEDPANLVRRSRFDVARIAEWSYRMRRRTITALASFLALYVAARRLGT